ncbi:5,10-methylenetetrahydrofolate reductase [Candidatus Hodgkinia cicadicola]|uniref:Methylenetetrahydrofolate reductase n=1 Tax=Candidatus Hodgkinia cicadicola TaxID=573658 RepID=A0ABX4MF62_9HYPH|nr:5,10-methylenetetrahydrofolate reductase [Candidatus Hodgkinia cicadicola]PIM96925.1 5,10-methylenetetrahydrofolate reductase [Candidatus Hodgkinia cicadicola]
MINQTSVSFVSANSIYVKFSVEYFPPRKISNLSKMMKSDLTPKQTKLLEFNSITCSSENKNRLNSTTFLLVVLRRLCNCSIVLHNLLTQIKCMLISDTPMFHDLGMNNMLLISGDKYTTNKRRSDDISPYKIRRLLRKKNVFNIGTGYPDNHILCSGSFQDLFTMLLNRESGCSMHITQIFNHMDNFLRNNLRCSMFKLGSLLPGLFISSKHPLAVDINLKCGIYLTRPVKELLESEYLDERAAFLFNLYRIIEIIKNDITWIQVFTLNKTRILKEIIWMLNDLTYYIRYWRLTNHNECYAIMSDMHNAYKRR